MTAQGAVFAAVLLFYAVLGCVCAIGILIFALLAERARHRATVSERDDAIKEKKFLSGLTQLGGQANRSMSMKLVRIRAVLDEEPDAAANPDVQAEASGHPTDRR